MRLDNQMVCVLADPMVYQEYFYQQYKKAKVLYDSAIQVGCEADRLIEMRAMLADYAGKLAITQGVLNNMPENITVSLWNNAQHKKNLINGDLNRLKEFEDYIIRVQKRCSEDIPENFNNSCLAHSG